MALLSDLKVVIGFGLCALCLRVAVGLYRCRANIRPNPIPNVPYNKESAARFLGDLVELKDVEDRRKWIYSQPQTHGAALAQVFIHPFEKPTVVVADYREVIDVTSRRFKEFDRGSRNKECMGLLAPNFHMTMETRDPRFKVHRQLLRDLMTPAFLNEVAAPRAYERASSLVELWKLKQGKAKGRPIAASHDLHLTTLDIICSVAFGLEEELSTLKQEISHQRSLPGQTYRDDDEAATNKPVEFPHAPIHVEMEALKGLPDMIAIAQRSPFPSFSLALAMLQPSNAKAWWYRRRLVRRQMTRSIKNWTDAEEPACRSALDQLLWREMHAAKKADRKPDLYSPIVRDELFGFILGGLDTSATVLSWWLKYMARHQPIQERLRHELRTTYSQAYRDGRAPTTRELTTTTVPYLNAVVEETLRCSSVVPMIVRTAKHDTEILGCKIPAGVNVILAATGPSITQQAVPVPEDLRSPACQHDKDRVPAWSDADVEEFNPERWLKHERKEDGTVEEVFDPRAGPNMAFSAGPRQCFGKKLAYVQLRTLVTLLTWNFEFGELDVEINGDAVSEKLINAPRDCFVKLSEV